MAREINRNLYPPMGYQFRDRDGFLHRASGWKALESLVIEYRRRNKFPIGDVWREIMDQVCAEVPGFCGETQSPVPKQLSEPTFNHKVLAWFAEMLARKRAGRWKLVPEHEAARRAAICAGCPMQKALTTSCATCIATVAKGQKALLTGVKQKNLNLHCCGALAEDCAVSVHAELEPVNHPSMPPNCWRRL